MPRKQVPPDHSEFGGGPGLVDAVQREDRLLEPFQEVWEIYATDPADEKSKPETAKLERP